MPPPVSDTASRTMPASGSAAARTVACRVPAGRDAIALRALLSRFTSICSMAVGQASATGESSAMSCSTRQLLDVGDMADRKRGAVRAPFQRARPCAAISRLRPAGECAIQGNSLAAQATAIGIGALRLGQRGVQARDVVVALHLLGGPAGDGRDIAAAVQHPQGAVESGHQAQQ